MKSNICTWCKKCSAAQISVSAAIMRIAYLFLDCLYVKRLRVLQQGQRLIRKNLAWVLEVRHTQRIRRACVRPSPRLFGPRRMSCHYARRSGGRRSSGGWLLRASWCGLGVCSVEGAECVGEQGWMRLEGQFSTLFLCPAPASMLAGGYPHSWRATYGTMLGPGGDVSMWFLRN
jgi:hypothetical protein